jgi:hypothetical protein
VTTKGWRPSWTNPGLNEMPWPLLDRTINRDLYVKRHAYINGNLTLGGLFNWPALKWTAYTPVLYGPGTVTGLGLPTPLRVDTRRSEALSTFPVRFPRSANSNAVLLSRLTTAFEIQGAFIARRVVTQPGPIPEIRLGIGLQAPQLLDRPRYPVHRCPYVVKM